MEKFSIDTVITHLETTSDEDWCMGVCRTKDQKQNCLLGHVFNMGKTQEESNNWCDWFENCVATTFMFFPINDGEHPGYPQPTPKLRCIAYLKDLQSGKEKTVLTLMEEHLFNSQMEIYK